ncbi:MAG: PQQ-binding-like beta-propeller repeat protein, partial [Aureliella sp.]
DRDFERLGSVARKYMHTQAGYDAQVLLAQYKLTSGHPLAAAGLLQNLLGYPAARQRYGAVLALATARALRAADSLDAAAATLKMAARNFPGESLTIAGQQMSLDAATDWKSVLSRNAEKEKPLLDASAGNSWTMSGGSPERNATSQASMPLPTERWVREIHSSLPEQEAIERQSQSEAQKGRVLLPKFELRMVGDLVLTKTTDSSLLAIDFETGVIKWPIYFHNAPVQLTNLPYSETGGKAALSDELQNRVWGSSAFGKFSCDEQRLYLISQQSDHILSGESLFKVDDSARDSNFLEGASLPAQGAILWRVGGSTGVDEPQLSGAYFLGPPLPYEGELYCVVDIRGETKLVVLDAATGRLSWKQQLVQAANSMPRRDIERSSQALSPTIADGVILCPTGVGAIVAVDLMSHGLRWGATYSTHRSNGNNAFLQRGAFGEGVEFSALERRWQEPGMIAQDGVVAFSPPESDEMFCRDILTGAVRLAPQRRNSYRYIAGLKNGRLYAVGERQVVAIDLSTGRPAWQRDFPKGLWLAGKGLWQLDSLLIPLSDNQLIRVSTDDGRVLETAHVSQPLGNLFAYKNQLLSVGSSSVTVYYTRDALFEEVAQRLAANPNDTWALNQQSQLALVKGDLTQALRSLEASYALDPNSADTRYLLIPHVGSTFAATQNRQRDIMLGDGHQVDSDAWIATELSRAYVAATPAERQSMQKSVTSELSSIENTMVPLRREKLRFLQWLPTANPALIELASSLLGGEEQTIAEQLLLPPLISDDEQNSQIALELLQLPAMSDKRFDIPNFDEARLAPGAGSFNAALLSPENVDSDSNYPAQSADWNRGLVRMDASDESRYQFGSKLELVSQRYGRPELSVALSASTVILRTGQGDDRAHFEFPEASSDASTDAITRATLRGGLLLVEKSSEVAAFDIHRDHASRVDAMLWRHSLLNPSAGPAVPFSIPDVTTVNTRLGFSLSHRQIPGKQQSLVGPLTPAGLVLQIGTRIILLDCLTGRQI